MARRKEEIEQLSSSKNLYALKFDVTVDHEVIDALKWVQESVVWDPFIYWSIVLVRFGLEEYWTVRRVRQWPYYTCEENKWAWCIPFMRRWEHPERQKCSDIGNVMLKKRVNRHWK
uniref:Uncharacterized protein n=2 Tax=Photinus pyralis TaxID=7054 RepID=A0A1Y1N0A3_PHOPY